MHDSFSSGRFFLYCWAAGLSSIPTNSVSWRRLSDCRYHFSLSFISHSLFLCLSLSHAIIFNFPIRSRFLRFKTQPLCLPLFFCFHVGHAPISLLPLTFTYHLSLRWTLCYEDSRPLCSCTCFCSILPLSSPITLPTFLYWSLNLSMQLRFHNTLPWDILWSNNYHQLTE